MTKDFLSLRIKSIVKETSDAFTFILEPVEKEIIQYRPGQFLTFIFDQHGHEVRRSFSLSSTYGIDEDLAVTIKRVPNGEITRLLLDHYKAGDIIKSLYPAGRFTLETTEEKRDIFLIGAGSGITPLFSLLKNSIKNEPQSHITLILGNRNESSVIFKNQLDILVSEYPNRLKVIHLLSDPSLDFSHLRSRLSKDLLHKLILENSIFSKQKSQFFLCGPSDFMRNAKITLISMEYNAEQIKQEEYIIKPVLQTGKENAIPRNVKLIYRNQIFDFSVTTETILQAALARNIRLPYSCRGGRCSACLAKCTKGKVYMQVNEVLTDKDVEDGYILTCTGHPESPEIEVVIG